MKYVGGLRVLLECTSMETLHKLTSGEATQIANWLTWIKPCEENRPGRVIWLNFEGVPLHAWHVGTFEMLAQQWGVVVEIENLTLYKKQLQRGRVCVLTTEYEMINSVVNLLVEGNSYKIRVMEDLFDGVDFGQRFAKNQFFIESESENEPERSEDDDGEGNDMLSDSDSSADEPPASE